MVFSLGRAHAQHVGNEVLQIFVAQGFGVVGRHQGFAGFLERFQFVFVEEVDLLARVHHLQGEAVFVEDYALKFGAVGGDDLHGLVFLGKFFHGFGDSLRQAAAGFADRFDQVVEGARGAGGGEIGTEAAAFAIDHVAGGAGRSVEQRFAASGVAGGFGGGFFLDAANVSDHLPDFLGSHANALLGGAVGGHGGAGNAVVDSVEEIGVSAAVLFPGAGQVGSTAAAAGSEAVAEGTIGAKLEFAELCHLFSCLGIAGVGIFVLSASRQDGDGE